MKHKWLATPFKDIFICANCEMGTEEVRLDSECEGNKIGGAEIKLRPVSIRVWGNGTTIVKNNQLNRRKKRMKGKIEKRIEKTTTKGKQYVSYKINDIWYSDWNNTQYPEGTEVEFQYKEQESISGKPFKNITSIVTAEGFKQAELPKIKTMLEHLEDAEKILNNFRKDSKMSDYEKLDLELRLATTFYIQNNKLRRWQ